MTELKPILVRLGLAQYLDSFLAEGFDSWETVLDITESDLEALNVKLGHRRKLQRAIADTRGHSPDRALASPSRSSFLDESRANESEEKPAQFAKPSGRELGPGGKRKYRRHPKPDENAPARPPSAYVIFSNKIRDDLKDHELSFTEIAKLVGEKWQELSAEGKEPFERQAGAAKEQYLAELSEYKKTQSYIDYLQYLSEFKAKYGGQQSDGKRPRLHPEQSMNSNASGGSSHSPVNQQGYHWSRVPIAPRVPEWDGVNQTGSPPSHRGSPSLMPGPPITASGHASPSSAGSMGSAPVLWSAKGGPRPLGPGGVQVSSSGSEEAPSELMKIDQGQGMLGEDQHFAGSVPPMSTDSGPGQSSWKSNIPSRRTYHHPSQPLPSLKGEDTSLSSISSISSGISGGSAASIPSRTMLPPLSRIDESAAQRSLPSLAASLSEGHLDQSPPIGRPSSSQPSPATSLGAYQPTPPSEGSTTLPPLASAGPPPQQQHRQDRGYFDDYQTTARQFGSRQSQSQAPAQTPASAPVPLQTQTQVQPFSDPRAFEMAVRDNPMVNRQPSPTDALLRQPLSRADTMENAS